MRVLSFNVGYLLGFQSQREWLRRPHRLGIADRDIEQAGLETLVSLFEKEQPDVAALQELDLGSVRTRLGNQCQTLINRLRASGLQYHHRADVKYGRDTVAGTLPVLRHMSNAVLWDGDYTTNDGQATYLSAGMKRLVQVLQSDQRPSVLSVHLSKTRETRQQQLRELHALVENLHPVILTGDFNVKESDEFSVLTDGGGLKLHSPGRSFSTAYPTYEYDVFLTSNELTLERCEVLSDITISDHMPVIADISQR